MILRAIVVTCLVTAAGVAVAQSDEERGLKLHKPEPSMA